MNVNECLWLISWYSRFIQILQSTHQNWRYLDFVFHTVYVNASKREIINMYIVVIEVNINKEAGQTIMDLLAKSGVK